MDIVTDTTTVDVDAVWDTVVGQSEAVSALRSWSVDPLHAYLFVGPSGTGKRQAARAFAAAVQALHFVGDYKQRTFIAITSSGYPGRVAHVMLEELQDSFLLSPAGQASLTAGPGELSAETRVMFQQLVSKYDDPAQVDRLIDEGCVWALLSDHLFTLCW